MIIPALYERQEGKGYLTEEDLRFVADTLSLPPYRVKALVTFFPHFRTTPPPKVNVHICRDMSCHLNASVELKQRVADWAQEKYGQDVEVCGASCLGRCDRPPAIMVNDHLIASGADERLKEAIDAIMAGDEPEYDSDWDLAKSKLGKWDIDNYEDGKGEYSVVKKYLIEPNPLEVFGEAKNENGEIKDGIQGALTSAGLLGMGGAGGRAYRKWRDVYCAKGKNKYVVCNADESEPGTFKDREILLAAPHLVVEGMTIAALSVGATRGWVYIRHEYHEQIDAVSAEIERAKRMNALGRNIFGSGQHFELEVFVSPGGYICGEQTALIETMEDKRAEPRIRPPELMTNGYLNQPTLLSNVETFAWVPRILQDGGTWFAEQGQTSGPLTAGSEKRMTGKRLFSISGDVKRPGVHEVPSGITLGELIDEYCDGMKDGKEIVAAALSGPSGGFLPLNIPVEHLNPNFVKMNVAAGTKEINVRDLPLDINVSRAVGYMLGAGIVIYGEGCDLLAEAVANSRFYHKETCGKCVPCRIGSQKITEMGERLLAGLVGPEELDDYERIILDLSGVMIETSICGLGQVAARPLQSFMRFYPDLARKACNSQGGPRS